MGDFYVSLTSVRVLVERWNNKAREIREGTRNHEMSSEEALAVAAQLEQCAEDLYEILTTRHTWVA